MKIIETGQGEEIFVAVSCPKCNCNFWVPGRVYEWYHRVLGEALYCPMGHGFHVVTANNDYRFENEREYMIRHIVNKQQVQGSVKV